MTLQDTLANALSHIIHNEKIGKKECTIKPISRIIKKIVSLMQDNRYLGEFTITERTNGEVMKLNLISAINNCGVIKPRYAISAKDFVKFEKRYLPAKNFGLLFVSTSQGIMTHHDAKEKKIGGRLLAYCY